jgi:hypothetical protein
MSRSASECVVCRPPSPVHSLALRVCRGVRPLCLAMRRAPYPRMCDVQNLPNPPRGGFAHRDPRPTDRRSRACTCESMYSKMVAVRNEPNSAVSRWNLVIVMEIRRVYLVKIRDCLIRYFLELTVLASTGRGRCAATPRSRTSATPAPTPGTDTGPSAARSGTHGSSSTAA